MTDTERLKREAAGRAVELVESGMRLGLGTGSTVAHFLQLLAERRERGEIHDVAGVATSVRTADRAHALGLHVGALHELAPLDLAVDGADEVDPGLDLIKGMGGALLREKMVAAQANRFVIIADEGKRVRRLGTRSPLPVEVVAFEWQVHVPFLESLGARPALRRGDDGAPVTTDNGNYVLDCTWADGLPDPAGLDAELVGRPGVVESGLFLGMADLAFLAGPDGVDVLERGGVP